MSASTREQLAYGKDRWGEGIDLKATNKKELFEFLLFKDLEFQYHDFQDDDLWEAFKDDFKDFTLQNLKTCDRNSLRSFKGMLRQRGVWVQDDRTISTAEALYNTLQEKEPSQWPEADIKDHLDKYQKFTSRRLGRYNRGGHLGEHDRAPDDSKDNVLRTPNQSFGRELANLAKLYTDEMRYSGEKDHFDYKLTIFNDLCNRADIPGDRDDIRIKAYPTMLRGLALDYYYTTIQRAVKDFAPTFDQVCEATRRYFEGPEYKRGIQSQWNSTTLQSVMNKPENGGKSTQDCLHLLVKDLRHLQHGLPKELGSETIFRDKLIEACRKTPACEYACFKPADNVIGLINDLQASIATFELRGNPTSQFPSDSTDQFFTDRRYRSNQDRPTRRPRFRSQSPYRRKYRSPTPGPPRVRFRDQSRRRRCFVCNKDGCWSTNHTKEEQESSKKNFTKSFDRQMRQYINEYEGTEDPRDDTGSDTDSTRDPAEAMIFDFSAIDLAQGHQDKELAQPTQSTQFFTSVGPIEHTDAFNTVTELANRSFAHSITANDPTTNRGQCDTRADPFVYKVSTNSNRYTSDRFYGVMIDTGASRGSTAGYGQYTAYTREVADTKLDTAKAGAINVQFGIGSTPSISSIKMDISVVGTAEFHVVRADTPFLLSLADMDTLGVYYNNLKDVLISPIQSIPVIRQFGHPFLLWGHSLQAHINHSFDNNPCFLTTTELRRLHRRFGHPAADRLYRLLERSGHDDVDRKAIDRLTKYCEHCQKYGRSPGRFKFTLRDDQDCEFNYSIYVDIMYIDGSPVLHVIDEATRFQAARWLQNISAKHTWDALRTCWMDTYVGPPEYITHDAGKNFVSKEFRQLARTMAISTKAVPVEAHWSIGLVERAHPILRRAYQIITNELRDISKGMALQMAVKATNDTAGPDGLVPTLLVFGAYPRMTELDPPAPSVTQRATAIKKAMTEVIKIRSKIQVQDALNHRNGPSVSPIHDLPLNSDVLVWREGNTGQSGHWDGPFKLLGIDRETCKVQLPSGPTDFRSTSVKPLLLEDQSDDTDQPDPGLDAESGPDQPLEPAGPAQPVDSVESQPVQEVADISIYIQDDHNSRSRPKSSRTNQPLRPPTPFADSRRKEVNGLLENGVFELVNTADIPPGARIFGSRFVDEVKNKGTEKAFEKSRLVVQGYGDTEKSTVLTQSPTIQRVSQRLILALAVILRKDAALYMRDITQAYTQSKTPLSRDFFIRPPSELRTALQLDEGCILRVVKPLYGVPEAGNHWFNTYHRHHLEKLGMEQSTYDPCLLYTPESGKSNGFGVVGLQTDDSLILADNHFADTEEARLQDAGLPSKPRERLSQQNPLKFNGGLIQLEPTNVVHLTQRRQCENIKLVAANKPVNLASSRGVIRKAVAPKDQYIAQRARGAYIASVSQPEACFDLSFAAQAIDPKDTDIKQLNKRLQWQINNASRGLRFVELDPETLRLIVFTDSSFANNQDLTSQIGFVIVLADKTDKANIIHWSSIKCKRVTRSVLASELYAMAHGFDMAAALKSTVERILPIELPLIVCTDSKSLYDCLVKLGTTRERRLMVDLLCLRQSYERRHIAEVIWVSGGSNPADAMTKSKPCPALKDLIDSNMVKINASEWVERL
jgi:hypothetical protein